MLEIEKLYNDPQYTVQVIAPSKNNQPNLNLRFLMTGQFSFSGSAEFTTLFQSARLNQMKEKLIKISQALSEIGGNKLSDIVNKMGVLQTVTDTLSIFVGYNKPTITVSVLDIALSQQHNPVTRLKQLLKAVYPEHATTTTVSKPFDYNPDFNTGTAKGLVTLRVSTFFEAVNWLVIRNVELQFSEEVSSYGFPIAGTATITFEPYKLPDYDTVANHWFQF